MFFDDYPLFATTSKTASSTSRLNLRHLAMIEANKDILDGARVLDLASHDGRWSFAALKAGAAHVTGVEARQGLVEGAEKTFAEYGVDKGAYDFVHGDLFAVLQEQDFDVDVVLCLGFMYHTLRYPELLHGITSTTPTHCVIDTKIIQNDQPTVLLRTNDTRAQSAAAKDNTAHGSTVIAGWPSLPALHMLLHTYGMDLEDQFDWPGLLAGNQDLLASVRDYHTEGRVTLRYRRRGDAGP
ncbi:MAG TPA: methyltransferase domain-containing protein [Nocardioidaceae bacterium]|nr:methyltransferase domain-containing protein [Nocardioidaceae bacterium]